MSINLKLSDNTDLPLPEDTVAAGKILVDAIKNSGRTSIADGKKFQWRSFIDAIITKDVVSISQLRPLLTTAIQTIIREPIEPLMQITPLFDRVEMQGMASTVIGGAMGAVYADDVGENSAYPEVSFQVAGGLQTATIGKSGLQVSFTDEALRYTSWDILNLNLRNMRKALIRHKEQKAVTFLKTYGTELFNNLSPSTSVFGVTTGRGLDMAANGSVIMDDLFKAMAHLTEEGFPPTYMIMHPTMFYTWIIDPVLRNMLLAHGGGTYFQRWQGNPGPLDPWSNGALGKSGPSLGNRVVPVGSASGDDPTGIAGREHGMTSAPTIPPYFPWPFSIIVSPFMTYDRTTGLTDIILTSEGNVGLLLVDEDPVQVEWRDEEREIQKIRIRERYGFQIVNEGMPIGLLRNIPTNARNYWDGTVSAHTLDVIAEISSTADLSTIL